MVVTWTSERKPGRRDAVTQWRRRVAWGVYRPGLLAALGVGLLVLLLDAALGLLLRHHGPSLAALIAPLDPSRSDIHRLALLAVSILAAFLVSTSALRLRLRGRLHRRMTEESNDFALITDEDGLCLYITPSVRHVTGDNPRDLLGFSVFDRVHPDDLRASRGFFQETLQSVSRTFHRLEVRIRHRDGHYLTFDLSITNCLNVPDIRGIVIHNRDVTHLKRVQRDQQRIGKSFRELFQSMFDPAAVVRLVRDEKHRVVDLIFEEVNAAMRTFVHPTAIEMRRGQELFPNAKPIWFERLRHTAERGETQIIREWASSFDRHLEISFSPFDGDRVAVVLRDTTEQVTSLDWMTRQRDLMLALGRAEDLDQALATALDGALAQSGMEMGAIHLLDPNGGLHLSCSRGVPDAMAQDVAYFGPDDPRTRLVLEGRARVLPYSEIDSLTENEKRERIQALVLTPIHHRGRVIGTLNVGTRHLGLLDDRKRQAVETIASQIGGVIAIHRAARDLRLSEHLFVTTLRSATEAILLTDTDARVTFLNPAAEALCAVSSGAALGCSLRDICSVCDELSRAPFSCAATAVLEGKPPLLDVEGLLCTPDGREVPVAQTACAIRDEAGKTLGAVLVFRDLSERRNLEHRLRQQQKLEALGTLAAGVAHEINNPVSIIANNGELLADLAHDPESVHRCAREILRESHRIAAIVRSLLSFARNEPRAHGTPVVLRDLIDETLSLTGKALQKNRVRVETDLPEDLPVPCWRGQQIQQVLVNLVTNANDALAERPAEAPEGRRLRISARLSSQGERPAIRLEVANNGPAIAHEVRARMFDPFFTTKDREKGTGLGLSVSYGIIQEHGGHVEVESRPGDWTRFGVELPLLAPESPRPTDRSRE